MAEDDGYEESLQYSQLGKSSFLDAPHHDRKERHFIEKVWGMPPVPSNPNPIANAGTSPIPARADHVHKGQFGVTARLNSLDPTTTAEPRINFIEGTGVDITVTDDPANQEIDVSFAVTGDAQANLLVRHNNGNVGTRPALNFLDSLGDPQTIQWTVTDDASAAAEVEVTGRVNPQYIINLLSVALRSGFGVNVVYDSGAGTFTFSINNQDWYQLLRLSVIGDYGINVTNDDPNRQIHLAFDNEDWYQLLRLSVLPGNNITIDQNEATNQITINSTGGGGGSGPGIVERIFDFNGIVHNATADYVSISNTQMFPATTYQLVAWTVRCMSNVGGTGIIVNVVKNGSTAGQPSASLTSNDLYEHQDTIATNTGTVDQPATPGTTWGAQVIPTVGNTTQGVTVTLYFRPVLP